LKNAASALTTKNSANQYGGSWSQHIDKADFIRQSSAVDLLNAVLSVQQIDLSYIEPLLLRDGSDVADLSYLEPLLLRDRSGVAADLSYLEPLLLRDGSDVADLSYLENL
jgi:hypothetical protein